MDFDGIEDSSFSQGEFPQATTPLFVATESMPWANEVMPSVNSAEDTTTMRQEIETLRAQHRIEQMESDSRFSQLQARFDLEKEERQELARRVDILIELLMRNQPGAMTYTPLEHGNAPTSINPADLQRRF